MLDESTLQSLHTNQRLLAEELQKRGVEVELLVLEIELLRARFGAHVEFLLDRDSSINPYPVSVLTADKALTKSILEEAGLSVTRGMNFPASQLDSALEFAQSLPQPLVVKPNRGSHGHGVHMYLDNLMDIKAALEDVFREYRECIVEEQFDAPEYRLFVTRNGDLAVLRRNPASVIGDGRSDLLQLSESESERRMNPRVNCLCPIVIDQIVLRHLSRSGKDLSYVPRTGERVLLRPNSNIAQGGDCEDFTDCAHPSVLELARRTLAAFPGLPFAGIDLLSRAIEKEQTPDNYRIVEINSSPGLHMHMRPARGASRNVASFVADLIFPETRR